GPILCHSEQPTAAHVPTIAGTYQHVWICHARGVWSGSRPRQRSRLFASRNSRTKISGTRRSGRIAGSTPKDRSSASLSPGAAFFSCLRRLLKHAVTNVRNGAASPERISGSARGVSLITLLRTLGGGRNAPGATVNNFSTRATACTPTDSAPYVFPPGLAASRSATSACTRKTTRSGRGGRSAFSNNG